MRSLLTSLILLPLVFGRAYAAPLDAQDPVKKPLKLNIKETRFGAITDSKSVRNYAISSDNSKVAILRNKGEKYIVSVNGVDGKEYDWILNMSLVISRDNQSVGYIVQEGDKFYTVIDGKEGAAYHAISGNDIAFAPAGNRYAYFAQHKKDGKWIAIVDSQEGKEFEVIGNLSFSPDGKRYAYGAQSGGKQFVVIDGVVGPSTEYEKVSGVSIQFSPDSKRLSFVAMKGDKYVMVIDGKESKPYEECGRAFFSADSAHHAFLCRTGDKRRVVIDGVEGKDYDSIVPDSFRFTPDGKRHAYVAVTKKQKNKEGDVDRIFYVIDGVDGKAHEFLVPNSFIFSPDGKRYCYQYVKQETKEVTGVKINKYIAVLDGVDSKPYDDIKQVQFSPDGKKLSYLAKRDTKETKESRVYAVIDNGEGRGYDTVANLLFSADSKRMIYVAQRGSKWFIVADAVEGTDYDAIIAANLIFSPDGKHYAFEAKRQDRVVFVIDSDETPPHAGSLKNTRLYFDKPNLLRAIVVLGNKEKTDIARWDVEISE